MASSDVTFHPTYGKRLRVEIERVTNTKSGRDWLEITVFDERNTAVGHICTFSADLKVSEDLLEAA